VQQNLFSPTAVKVSILVSILCIICVSSSEAVPRIRLEVQDTSVVVGQPFNLKIYLDNPVDSVAGFSFLLAMNRPDIAKFDLSGIGCDTSGTLSSGAEIITANDFFGNGATLKFLCLYNGIDIPAITPPLAPQTGGVAVKLRINTFLTPFPLDDTLEIFIEPSLGYTSFADPHGNTIGIIQDTIVDTTGWHCTAWNADTCLIWERCGNIENCADSLFIDTVPHTYFDTTQVSLINSRSFISLPNCDNTGNIKVNVIDLVCVIRYLFGGFDQSTCSTFHCDANKSGGVNVADVTYLVRYLFNGGPPPQ
jgi:hypothetical protein